MEHLIDLSKSTSKEIPGNPQIVATDGTHIVIERGSKYYGVIAIGQSIKDIKKWYDRKLLSSLLMKGDYVLLKEPEPYEEPTEDVKKAHVLHKERLIKRRVPVKHSDGKITYRMQWVDASQSHPEVHTGHHEEEPHYKPMHHFIDADYQVVDDNNEEEDDTSWDDSDTNPNPHHVDDEDLTPISDEEFDDHFGRETPIPKEDLTKKMVKGSSDYLKDMKDYGIPEDLQGYMSQLAKADIPYYDEDDDIPGYTTAFGAFAEIASSHFSSIHQQVMNDIETSDSTHLAKTIQKRTLNITKSRDFDNDAFVRLGAHPGVLRHAVDTVLGKDLADTLRGQMEDCNITINTYVDSLGSMMKEGYRASTLESYAQKKLRPSDYEKLQQAYTMDNFDDALDYIKEIQDNAKTRDDQWVISAIIDRLEAEHDAMGIDLEDPKPCYIAFNPQGDKHGGTTEYGDGGVLQVDESVLKNSTLNYDDTFIKASPVARIKNREHLKDLMILKVALKDVRREKDDHSIFHTEEGKLSENWLRSGGAAGLIPLEIQYHNHTVEPEHLSIYNDRPTYSEVSDHYGF